MTAGESDDSGDGDAWDPEPSELREGEHSDVFGHAQRNIALLREGVRDGAISDETAAEGVARIQARDAERRPEPSSPAGEDTGRVWCDRE